MSLHIKTKVVQHDRKLKKMKLCGNFLPWEESAKHLGNKIMNEMNGLKQDIKEKRARYISRNNEILQEFSYAHPRTKFEVNKIFNSHFSGQVLWDLFCRESEMVENTWNVSFRLTFNLPRNTHKFLVQPKTFYNFWGGCRSVETIHSKYSLPFQIPCRKDPKEPDRKNAS